MNVYSFPSTMRRNGRLARYYLGASLCTVVLLTVPLVAAFAAVPIIAPLSPSSSTTDVASSTTTRALFAIRNDDAVKSKDDESTAESPRADWLKSLRAFGRRRHHHHHHHRTSLSSSSSSSSSSTSTDAEQGVSMDNLSLLSERGRAALERLMEHDRATSRSTGSNSGTAAAQVHVYGDWPPAGTEDDGKRRLTEQLADLDESYPGGLALYLTKAQRLLIESAEGYNPYDEFTAQVPEGQVLSLYQSSESSSSETDFGMADAEALGWQAASGLVFVLVAGGLGERLGYSGIKLSLETEVCTDTCYLEFYARYIHAIQTKVQQRQQLNNESFRIPLVIMTSGDTDAATRQLLTESSYFGLDPSQVTIVTQDKVAALRDGAAGLAMSDRWTIDTKPHGHGDVHSLLLRAGLVEQWERDQKSHVVFLQDTNALVVNSVLPTLGVSVKLGLHMNSICIPRLAGEAAGAITRLEHKTDPNKSLVINVEYNQLDPLLRTQGDGQGDVADPKTGYSPYPGNANNLILELAAYAKTLRGEDQGVVLEFVNPKYKDATRTAFKKPTRLECMMQDIPKLYQKEMGTDAKIGFTMFDRWFTFSPAKNALDAGQDAVKGGSSAPGTMSTAESDLYVQNQHKLKHAGVDLSITLSEADCVPVAGIPVTPGPRIVVDPSFGVSSFEFAEKIQGTVRITQRSSLVLQGRHVTIRGLDLDGALVIRAGDESVVTVDGLTVANQGWEYEELNPDTDYPESVRIRGYTMKKRDTKEYSIFEPGKFVIDASGEVSKVD